MALADLDYLDRRIIMALERDGRRPYRDIARELGVAEATIRSRVNRMTERELIHIEAVGDPLKLGVEVVAISLIRVKPGHVQETAEILTRYPNVRFVGISLGAADIIIQTLHASLRDLHGFIAQELPRAAPAVTSTETFQLAEVHKSSWDWRAWFEQGERFAGRAPNDKETVP
ncbi:MAG: Lrp/AsnC family transcriptional regulator [Truepera sp.]|nr:Lrp/AsnC family transcriptional regulator [Truepera sp.]